MREIHEKEMTELIKENSRYRELVRRMLKVKDTIHTIFGFIVIGLFGSLIYSLTQLNWQMAISCLLIFFLTRGAVKVLRKSIIKELNSEMLDIEEEYLKEIN